MFSLTHWFVPGLGFVIFYPSGNLYKARNLFSGEVFCFPEIPGVVELYNVGMGYRRKSKQKYTLPGFVDVGPGDIVVDVGAFVGAFSLAVSPISSNIIACEPSPMTVKALKSNTVMYDNIEVHQLLLFNETKEAELQVGQDLTDNSVINVDGRSRNETITVQGVRLDKLASEIGFDAIDFLKVDAEGAEPEVLEGAKNIDIRKVAIDCGAERHGESTDNEVADILGDRGFDVRKRGDIVFGRL